MKKYIITVLNSKIPALVGVEIEARARSFEGAARQFKRKYHVKGEFFGENNGEYLTGNFYTLARGGGYDNTFTRLFIKRK